MAARAVIFGARGEELDRDERRFLADADPWGFILFGRNIAGPEQLRRLTADLRTVVGRDAPILIDQEGGRVARMRAPAWREWLPALEECHRLPDAGLRARAMHLRYRLIADELRDVGIDVNCAPVLDLVQPETHPVIRNRCYGENPAEVASIGRAVAEGLLAGGVLPIVKHMPGQGRANLDSHKALPRVEAPAADLQADFTPFRALADLPMAMTAHVIYAALDPERPATQSPRMLRLIREDIGFGGLVMTDDLSMHALSGSFAGRAERALAAGCDMVLHCNGDREEMAAVLDSVPRLDGAAHERAEAALALRIRPEREDAGALAAEFAAIGMGAHA